MIHFLVPAAGAYTLEEYFSLEPPELVRRFRVISYEDLLRQTVFPRGTYVWAGLDQLSPAMYRVVQLVHDRLQPEAGIRILNDPASFLRRFDLLQALHAQGRNDFCAYRAATDPRGLRFPVFLRGERSHDGNLSPLVHSVPELERAVGLALVRGHSLSDLLVIEFCPTVDADGLYRKYAAFRVGDRILARSLYHSPQWMVKFADSVYTRALVMEEQQYVATNPHAAELKEIFDLAHVDFGLIDYSFKDGRIQVWEINVHPSFGRGAGPDGGVGPRELRPLRSETRELFFDRFREAWAEVDQDSSELPAISIVAEPELLRAAARKPHQGRLLGWLRTLARPVKPLIMPLMLPVLRILGTLARKRGRP